MALQTQQEDHHQHHHHLHFVLVPQLAPGHFIPVLDMAILLAQRDGITATIVTTPRVAARFTSRIDRAVQSGNKVRLLTVKFPTEEVGLPEGCETAEDVDSAEEMSKFGAAIGKLQQPFEELFKDVQPRPSCILADKHITWLADTARKFSVPRIIFESMSCFTLVCNHVLRVNPKLYETGDVSDHQPFLLPGLPHEIGLTRAQLPMWFQPGSSGFLKAIESSESKAYGVAVNSFEELEPEYIQRLKKLKGDDRVWCVGPVSRSNTSDLDKSQRGNKSSIDENKCLGWLDRHEPGSVVYACLGSISRLTMPQMIELGLGLEASGVPFIWVVRGSKKFCEDMDKWLTQDGYEERNKERGLVIRGWAPQLLILSHPSVGAFLTHCGWNSSLEGVCAGVPMITWPLFAEQFFNEKFIVNVLGVGVSVGNKFAVHYYWGLDDCEVVAVKREMVTKAVEEVMKGGQERIRSKAKVLGKMARKVIEDEDGSSYLNVTLLIEHVQKLQT